MATFTTTANALKYASGSSWSSGKARQGVYSSTRYEGAISFSGLSGLDFSNIAISRIKLNVTFGAAGGSSTKYLTFYKATSNTISGSIGGMRGTSLGRISVSNAYNRAVTLTFDNSTNAALFTALRDYFMSGKRVLIIYVPTTRGTYDGGFCYDYLSVTAASLTITFDYLQSDGSLASTSVNAGSTATLNITAYNPVYSHRVTWSFGSNTYTQIVSAGDTVASYTIPLSWLSAIPSALSGAASVTLETLDADGNSLGAYSYGFTITVPSSVVPTIGNVSSTPVNTSSVIAGWNLYASGKSAAAITINNAAGAYGSTIKSYRITTEPSIGNGEAASLTTGIISKTGTITITGTVTDSRGRTATKTTTINVYQYGAPYFTATAAYRCTSNGTRDDLNGTYAYVNVSFARYALSGSNNVSCSMMLRQVGGSYTYTGSLTSGTGVIVGGGSLVADSAYEVVLTLTDTVGSTSTFTLDIGSAQYIMHVKKGGKAIGFGMAAGDDNTVSFGWAVKLSAPLEVSQGGTGASTAAGALNAIGAAASGHTHTPDSIGAAASSHAHTLTDLSGTLSVEKGGTGAATAKAALNALGVFYADALPASGTDGQICLVPVS